MESERQVEVNQKVRSYPRTIPLGGRMQNVSRKLLLAGVLAFGTLTAACGDKVNILQPSTQVGVQSVTVTPSAASVTQGQTIQLSATVVADANTAKTVSWASSNTAVA